MIGYLVTFLSILLILWILYGIFYKIKFRKYFKKHTLTLSDFIAIAFGVVSIVSLIVSLQALDVAIQQLEDARSGSKEQGEILRKQQLALEESRNALVATNKNLSEQQKILNKSLSISIQEWENQQRIAAQRPQFEIRYCFTQFVIKGKNGFEVNNGYFSETSKWFFEKDTNNRAYEIMRSNTLSIENGMRMRSNGGYRSYFILNMNIINKGQAVAEDLKIVIKPNIYGLFVTSDTEKMEMAMGPIASFTGGVTSQDGIISRPKLNTVEKGNDQLHIPLKVIVDESIGNKVIQINVGVYSQNASIHVVPIKFMLIKDELP